MNGVNSLLTARKDNVEHMPTVGSGTQPQLSQDCIPPFLVQYTNRVWILQI